MTFTEDLKLFYAGLLHPLSGHLSQYFVSIRSVPSLEKNFTIGTIVFEGDESRKQRPL
jgi:hypothetical protein